MESNCLASYIEFSFQVTPNRYQLSQIGQIGQIPLNCCPLFQQLEVTLQRCATTSPLNLRVLINESTAVFDVTTLCLETQRCS
ncbi:hypothetical protein D3C76_1743870 [compost metagenome]